MNNMKYIGFVYITTNKINNKKYIGMHRGHKDDSYLGSGKLIRKAIDKYGKENFSRKIIEYADSFEELCELEKFYIEKYNAVRDDNFYNIHDGGFGGNNLAAYDFKKMETYKVKLEELPKNHNQKDENKKSNKELSKFSSNQLGELNPNYGNTWSEEKKKSLSKLRIANGKSKGELNGMFGKKGHEAINGKKIYMYDSNWNLLYTFNTVGLALEFLEVNGHSTLYKRIKTKTIYKGYYWSKELI